MLLRGVAARGDRAAVRTITRALIDLATELGGELPELLGGFARVDHPTPIAYPASARPQAWAAAVPFQVVTALLGLRPDLPERSARSPSGARRP